LTWERSRLDNEFQKRATDKGEEVAHSTMEQPDGDIVFLTALPGTGDTKTDASIPRWKIP
jgi:hypothetical protein